MALGVTLNTKAGLGISPVTAVPYSIAHALHISFAMTVFLVCAVMLVIQFLLKGSKREWKDLLQIPFSFVFSAFLDLVCVAIAVAVDLVFTGRLSSVGIGTFIVMVFTGRVVYVFNRFFRKKLVKLAGLEG